MEPKVSRSMDPTLHQATQYLLLDGICQFRYQLDVENLGNFGKTGHRKFQT